MKAPILITLLLCYGCAGGGNKDTTPDDAGGDRGTGGGTDGGGGGRSDADGGGDGGGADGRVDGPANDTRSSDGAVIPDDGGTFPPSPRDGRIPTPPNHEPPCAADSNAGHGNVCPYKDVTVGCRITGDGGRALLCICSRILGDKWLCEPAPDGGIGIAGLEP